MKTELIRRGAAAPSWRRSTALAILLVLFAVGACADSGGDGMDAASDGGQEVEAQEADSAQTGVVDAARGSGGSDESEGLALGGDTSSSGGKISAAAALPRVGPSVIKTASVSIGVADDKLDEATNESIAIAGRYGGFVLSSKLGRAGSGGTLTMRVPAGRFEAALADLEGLGKVRSETISGEDVGQEFVDLEARLRNWEAQEAVLLKLMDRAESVTDTIKVQSELSRIQLEIEQIRGRLRFLRDQTSLGTITATFAPLTAKPDAPNRFAKAWSRAVDLMQSFVSGLIVTTGVIVPLAVIALIAYLIFRGVKPRFSG